MSRINNSFYAILGILGFSPMSGYGIKEWVDEGVGFFWDIDYKQIYPTLKKMTEEGLPTSKAEKTGSRPESKVYTITDMGLVELRSWLNQPVSEGRNSMNELRLKLFFGHHVPVEKNIEHVKRNKEAGLLALAALEEVKVCLEKEEVRDESWHYRMLTVMNGEMLRKAGIQWCDRTIEYLERLKRCNKGCIPNFV